MKGMLGALVTLITIASMAGPAQSQPILTQRCNADNLDPTAAEARLTWARRCALTQHVGNINAWFDTFIPASNGGGNLKEYTEDDTATNFWGQNSFIGQINSFEVNYTGTTNLYLSGPTSQFTDALNYFRWERPIARKRARPLYPTYGSQADINSASNVQLYASTNPTDCTFYLNAARTIPAPTSTYSYYVNGFCESSCYAPDQRILFPEGEAAIVDAVAAMKPRVMTLTPGSSLESFSLQSSPTHSYTAEFRDTKHPIIELTMESGGMLRVTTEHPMVNSEGRLVAAQTLKAGDELVRKDGSFDTIVSAVRKEHFGKVYNLRPETDDRISNILVAEGYLVGSSLFQNDDVGYINRIILHSVPSTLIP
jgi:hypothetical protein